MSVTTESLYYYNSLYANSVHIDRQQSRRTPDCNRRNNGGCGDGHHDIDLCNCQSRRRHWFTL